MGTSRTILAAAETQTQRWAAPRTEPKRADRHSVCAPDRHPLGVSAQGVGSGVRDDLLASLAGLASGRSLGESLARPAGRVGPGQRHRLVGGGDRQLLGAGHFWGAKTGPNPTDRGKNGSKRHLIVDGNGTPLAVDHTGANVHDSEMAMPLVDAIEPIKRPQGRPRKRPEAVYADRAYDAEEKIREPLRRRGIIPMIAKRNTEHGSGLGTIRWVVEAAFSWLFKQRRLRVRYEKRDDIHQAFLSIGCLLICWHRVSGFC